MQSLINQIEFFEQQIATFRESIRELLKPFFIDDKTYINVNITVNVEWWDYEGCWRVFDNKGYCSGNSDTTVWLIIWNMLHGINNCYDEQIKSDDCYES